MPSLSRYSRSRDLNQGHQRTLGRSTQIAAALGLYTVFLIGGHHSPSGLDGIDDMGFRLLNFASGIRYIRMNQPLYMLKGDTTGAGQHDTLAPLAIIIGGDDLGDSYPQHSVVDWRMDG